MAASVAPLALRASPCRFCGTPLEHSFVDLGAQPPSNSYLRPSDLTRMEPTFPLHAHVCGACFLVQLEAFHAPEQIFSDYAYFSSYSESWLRHAETYAAAMVERLGLDGTSHVVEVASNDGYLLQHFVRRGIPVLGVEPAANVARVATGKGVPTRVGFFGRATARKLVEDGHRADLLVGNNVLAHVPDLNDFVAALRMTLKPDGVLTMEFPHLLHLMEKAQFDTIYHEHFSYFSFLTAERIFAAHGIRLFDVDELPTHGGSLRIYGSPADAVRPIAPTVAALRARERAAGLDRLESYDGFADRVKGMKRRLLAFLIDARERGKSVVGYGAAAKGNTLLNYCGVRGDFLDYVADASPHKQGTFLPGTRIPVVAPRRIAETRPDYVLILPWNIRDEVIAANAYIRDWGGKFVVPIPEPTVIQ
jgi:SAM-dependent methyltransferase